MSAIAAYKTKLNLLTNHQSDGMANFSVTTDYVAGSVINFTSGGYHQDSQIVDTTSVLIYESPDGGDRSDTPISSELFVVLPNFTLMFKETPAADIRYLVTFSYWNFTAIIGTNQSSMTIGGDILDPTDQVHAQQHDGFKNMIYGLLDASASLTRYEQDSITELDPTIMSRLLAREPIMLQRECDGLTLRGLFTIESISSEGEVSSLSSQTINLQLKGDFLWLI